MRITRLFPILLLLVMAAVSCDLHTTRTVIGYGAVEDEKLATEAFSGVNITGSCNVHVSIGEEQSILISAQPQIHEALSYDVDNDILNIGVKPDYKIHTDEEIRATIIVPSFDFAGITGEGDFNISGPLQDKLYIHISGAGNVEAFDMETKNCNIHINGVGNCDVNVSDSLQVIVSGVGYVRYMGNPEVESYIHGVGEVRPMDE